MQYGILIGRFQPLHNGHQTIIDEIIDDGLIPIIFIGSSNRKNERNPLSYEQRVSLFQIAYHGILTFPLPDRRMDGDWVIQIANILSSVNIGFNQCKLYFYGKDGDFDITYLVETWFEIYKPVSKMPNISATQIRENPEGNMSNMHFSVHNAYMRMINKPINN